MPRVWLHSPKSSQTLCVCVCSCRIRELWQPCECTGSYSGHERLPDRNEEVESPTKETEGCQPPLLTRPTFSIHCSSTGEGSPGTRLNIKSTLCIKAHSYVQTRRNYSGWFHMRHSRGINYRKICHHSDWQRLIGVPAWVSSLQTITQI